MKKTGCRTLAPLLAAAMLITALTACGAAPDKERTLRVEEKTSGFTAFDSAVIDYLEANGYAEESFLFSPLSYKAALALAVLGAEGETKEQLLQGLGFADEQELLAWYDGVLKAVDAFDEVVKEAGSFRVANSVWENTDLLHGFRKDYVQRVGEALRATADGAPEAELADRVNAWINEQTEGMIPKLVEDLSDSGSAAVLVNALYLRSAWRTSFREENTREGLFTTAQGEEKQMLFMHQQDDYDYYEDRATQLVVLPMHGFINMAFVLGSTKDIEKKLAEAEWEDVVLTLPKFELETALTDSELKDFLLQRGVELPFSKYDADFTAMSEPDVFVERWYIGDILQKSKFKMDEQEVEASSATAIEMVPAMALPSEPKEPKIFTADRPFAFYIYSDYGDTPELLFFGQYLG